MASSVSTLYRDERPRAASIELTLGNSVAHRAAGKNVKIGGRKVFCSKPGRAVQASAPGSASDFRTTMSAASAACERWSAPASSPRIAFQIEPGFEGHLQFCLFNAGGAPFRLRGG